MNAKSLTKFILVLDLDSTLIHSYSDMKKYEKLKIHSLNHELKERVYDFELVDVSETPGSGIINKMWGIYRPHLKEFIHFACMYFEEIRIWSAGKFKYVSAIVDSIFDGDRNKLPSVVKTYEDCQMTGNNIYKPLKKFDCGDMNRIFALDDRSDTFSLNPGNGIKIPIYEPNATLKDIMEDEICLLQLMYWFKLPEVMSSVNVTLLDKSKIFTTSLQSYESRLE